MPTYTTKTTPSARGPGGTLSASCFAVHNAQNWALASAQITTYLQAPNAPCLAATRTTPSTHFKWSFPTNLR